MAATRCSTTSDETWLVAHGARPSQEDVERRALGFSLAASALEGRLQSNGLRVSPLGPGWSSDIDAHMTVAPDDADLERRGWMRVDPLLRRIGIRGGQRWAVFSGDQLLTAVDITFAARPDVATSVLDRCVRRRHVGLREVAELRVLRRAGARLPAPPHAELAAAAALEAAVGLPDPLLDPWRDGQVASPPAAARAQRILRRVPGRLLRFARPRLVVAVSGVDGAGKSTLCRSVACALDRAGVPAAVVWTRPGMRLGRLGRAALALGRRAIPGTEPVERIAQPAAPDLGGRRRTRRGVLGWSWAMLVTCSYLGDVWKQHLGSSGVLVYDRHSLDASVTLDLLHEGVDLRVHKLLVHHLVPKASLSFYLDIDAVRASTRKPDPSFDLRAIEVQLEHYHRRLEGADGVVRLDGTEDREHLTASIVRRVLRASGGRAASSRPWGG